MRFTLLSFRDKLKDARVSSVEISLLLTLLVFGVPMAILIPPGAGYDEEDHLIRVWELSAFSFIPGELSPQEMKYPTVFRDFAYRQQGSTGVIDSEFWQSYSRAGLYERGFIRREIDTKSVYSPALLLPQGIVMRLSGRGVGLPALVVFSLCRLMGLLSYLFLVWLAIRWIPFGKWILLALAIAPMAIFQAATITPDSISNGIGFLFIAGSLRAAAYKEIGWREFGQLGILIALLFLTKLNLLPLILLPFLLVSPSKFAPKRIYGFLLLTTLVLFVVEVAGWNWIASRNFESLLLQEANPSAQLLYTLGHPFAFLATVAQDVITNGWIYLQGWINGYGYYYWTPPLLVSLLFLLGLAAALVVDAISKPQANKLRAGLILVFLAGYLATIASLYLSFTPIGADYVNGVQGRYFIPLALPLFLAFSTLFSRKWVVSPNWIMILLGTGLILNLAGIFFSFHVPCGSTFYQTGLCYRPLFKDFPNEVRLSQPISNEVALTQEVWVNCDGLAELRVLLTPSTPDGNGKTRFVIKDPSTQETLLDTTLPNDQITTETWYPLRFEPNWSSAGKVYILEIRGLAASPPQGLQILYTPQPEFDLGNSYENGKQVEEDVLLQYGCVAGLRKLWLRRIR
jgi:uncharacterized membrane protein